jgi:hypothetical protein
MEEWKKSNNISLVHGESKSGRFDARPCKALMLEIQVLLVIEQFALAPTFQEDPKGIDTHVALLVHSVKNRAIRFPLTLVSFAFLLVHFVT